MPQGQAVDIRDRQFIVLLRKYFAQERNEGKVVSTIDPDERVEKVMGIGKRTVQEVYGEYKKTGKIIPAKIEFKGKPPYKISPQLETVIRR